MTELDVTALLLYQWKDEQEKGLWLGTPDRPWWKRLAMWLRRREDIFIYVGGLCEKIPEGQILISASSVWLHAFGCPFPIDKVTPVSDLEFMRFVEMFYTIAAHETFHSVMRGEGLSGYEEETVLQRMGLESSLNVFDWNEVGEVGNVLNEVGEL